MAVVAMVAVPCARGASAAGADVPVVPPVSQIGTVSMGANSLLSAGVYDAGGQLVRHLDELAPEAGTVQMNWDGKDDAGNVLPAGTYNWRAATSSVTGANEGGVGVGGTPLPGLAFDAVRNPGDASAVAYGPDGNFYLDSTYEELNSSDVYRYSPADLPTGLETWYAKDGFGLEGHAIAVDGQYVYVGAHADYDANLKDWVHNGIFRVDAATGNIVGWPGLDHIVISDWRTAAGDTPVTGIAVDATHLWVVDGADNQIKVFNKSGGSPAMILGGGNSMPVDAPRGIVTDGAGRFWIAGATGVTQYTYDPASQSMTPGAQIALGHAYGVAWDHSNGASILYVSEIDTGEVHKYDVSGAAPVQLAAWFGSYQPSKQPHSRSPDHVRSMKRATGAVSAFTTDTVPVASEP
jgi:hypothetical protein